MNEGSDYPDDLKFLGVDSLRFLDRLGTETSSLSDADAILATTTRLVGKYLSLSVCAYADMDEDADGFTIRGDWAAPGSTSIVGFTTRKWRICPTFKNVSGTQVGLTV
ncbi:hypothetical protein, partial [Agrobacterium vitis]